MVGAASIVLVTKQKLAKYIAKSLPGRSRRKRTTTSFSSSIVGLSWTSGVFVLGHCLPGLTALLQGDWSRIRNPIGQRANAQ